MDERTDFGVDQIQFELGDLPGWWKWAIALTDWVDRLSVSSEAVGPVPSERPVSRPARRLDEFGSGC